MGKIALIVCFTIVACALIVEAGPTSQSCPLSSKMTNCSPKCKDDSECFGQKCCPNLCNSKSCTQANQATSNTGYKGSSSGATGSYCGNVKCNAYEKCQLDKSTKREKCTRS